MTSSAAISMHHDLRGGLLYHSYRMVKAADALCGVYTDLDRELLLCGTALHDIGKVWEYKTSISGDAAFTASGVLFGHLYMGAALIKGFTADGNYNKEKVQLLIHMILSHHGTQEWGAVSCPAIPEAFALHYIDDLQERSRKRSPLVLITVSTSRTSISNFEPTGFKVPLKQKRWHEASVFRHYLFKAFIICKASSALSSGRVLNCATSSFSFSFRIETSPSSLKNSARVTPIGVSSF